MIHRSIEGNSSLASQWLDQHTKFFYDHFSSLSVANGECGQIKEPTASEISAQDHYKYPPLYRGSTRHPATDIHEAQCDILVPSLHVRYSTVDNLVISVGSFVRVMFKRVSAR